jgi:E3 ubiquitin-protein ligase RNF213
MQLIYNNLRGPDSKNKFFQKLPQVFVIPYQGSESSTSDGIMKVFEKANKYLEKNKKVKPLYPTGRAS